MTTKRTSQASELSSVGIDIGKDVFHLVGFSPSGEIVLRKKIKRLSLVPTFDRLPRCIVGMEACLSAHFMSRSLRRLGFESRIIPIFAADEVQPTCTLLGISRLYDPDAMIELEATAVA
jgi:hypothetical protein